MKLRSSIFLFLFLCLLAGGLFAKAIEVPKPKEEIKTKDQPSEAANYQAIITLNEDTIDATGSSTVVKEHRIIKLLSPEAVQRYSRILEFSYVVPAQKWTIDDVKVTSADGKVETVSTADAKEVPLSQIPPYNNMSYPPYNDFRLIYLPLKILQPGSTLEYTATFTDQPWISDNYWESVYLQDQDPITKERITVVENAGATADVQELHGSLPAPETTHQADKTIRTWEWENIEAYPSTANDRNAPAAADIAPQLVISSLKGWDKVAQEVSAQFLMPASPGNLDPALADILKEAGSPAQKLKAIYSYTDQNVRTLPMGGDFAKIPHALDYDAIMKQGLGDSRDKAALLAAFLKKAGFDAQLALISTSANGTVPESIPLPSAFNRLIVRAKHEGKVVWLDPYVENCPFDYLPPEDQGRRALLIDTGEFVDTPVFPAQDNSREVNVQATISNDGGLVESLDMKANGSDSIAMRSLLKSVQPDQRQQLLSSLASQIASNPKDVEVMLSSLDDLSNPISIGLKFQAKNFMEVEGDLAWFRMPFNDLSGLRSILKESTPRQYPFILGSTTREIKHLDLTIPQGYKIRYLPKGTIMKNPVGTYEAHFSSEKNKIVFQSTFTLDKVSITPGEFDGLKNLVAFKVKMEEVKIVLEKNKKSEATH